MSIIFMKKLGINYKLNINFFGNINNSNIKNEISGESNLSKQNISGGIRKEEIDFYTMQICPKCKSYIGNIYDMINLRSEKIKIILQMQKM